MKGNIILCGFMGCGKSSVGRRAAVLCGRELCDLDRYIEEKAGMTVSEIFAGGGRDPGADNRQRRRHCAQRR